MVDEGQTHPGVIGSHEQRMRATEDRVAKLEIECDVIRDRYYVGMEGIRSEMNQLHLSVKDEVSDALKAMVTGVAQEAREALTTARAAHGRTDDVRHEIQQLQHDVRNEVRQLQGQLIKLGKRVVWILATMAAAGYGSWQIFQ